MKYEDAVVPDGRDSAVNGLPQIPFHHAGVPSGVPQYGTKLYDTTAQSAGGYAPQAVAHNSAALVPQLAPQQFAKLTASQQAELELARRRAQKAAEGKRANATAARRAKRKAQQKVLEAGSDKEEEDNSFTRPPETDGHGQTDSDIEAKLATVEDQKEAKRLKRLLRNRVSAQQARERKKSYVQELEASSKVQGQQVSQLEQRVKVLERENVMLRQVIKNMQGSRGDGHL